MHFATLLKSFALLATSSMVLSARLPIRDDSTTLPILHAAGSAEVTPRASNDDPSWYVGHFCTPVPGQPWQTVFYPEAIDAIVALRSDGPGVSVDPGVCEQLTCTSGAAIYWCNDSDFTFTSDTDYLADMAQYLALLCYVYQEPPLNQGFTGGQVFDDWGMNIIIQAEDCANDRRTVKREELMAGRRDTESSQVAARDTDTLHSRDDAGHVCSPVGGQPWETVDYGSFSRAIQAISDGDVGGNVGIGAGPAYCQGLVCVGDAAISLCNDNPYFITVSSDRIVQMAEGIQGVCYHYFPGIGAMTGGQLFDTGSFNVIVQYAKCFDQRDAFKREELTYASVAAREAEVSVTVVAGELAAPVSARDPTGLLCIKDGTIAWDWNMVAVNGPILDAIQALRNADNGGVIVGGGPAYCEQIACADNAAIYLCNDNPYPVILNVNDLATMAVTIYNDCSENGQWTGGQMFDTGSFNVIVNENQCLPWVPRRVKREALMAPFQERESKTS